MDCQSIAYGLLDSRLPSDPVFHSLFFCMSRIRQSQYDACFQTTLAANPYGRFVQLECLEEKFQRAKDLYDQVICSSPSTATQVHSVVHGVLCGLLCAKAVDVAVNIFQRLPHQMGFPKGGKKIGVVGTVIKIGIIARNLLFSHGETRSPMSYFATSVGLGVMANGLLNRVEAKYKVSTDLHSLMLLLSSAACCLSHTYGWISPDEHRLICEKIIWLESPVSYPF